MPVSPRSARPSTPSWVDRDAYPFRSRFVELSTGRMHYVDEGSGDPILFVHGTPTWSFEFRHLIRALAPRWRCVAFDHLGFGLSDRPAGFAYSPEAHAANVRELVGRLGLRNPVLVVHDFGGPIGLPLALDGLVAGLVMFNTWMWPFDDDPEMLRRAHLVHGALGRFLYRWANASLRLLAPSAYADRTKLTPAIHRQYLEPFRDRDARVQVLWALARALTDSRDYYALLWQRGERLRAYRPLIVWGMKDSAFRPNQLARWESLLREATVVRLLDAGHWPHEEAPDECLEAMTRYLVQITTLPQNPIGGVYIDGNVAPSS